MVFMRWLSKAKKKKVFGNPEDQSVFTGYLSVDGRVILKHKLPAVRV
jgi:hypothetical protein